MVFKPRQKRQNLDIKLEISIIVHTMFLGVILDENLTWKPHIANVTRKVFKSMGVIYKSSVCLPITSLICISCLKNIFSIRQIHSLKYRSCA